MRERRDCYIIANASSTATHITKINDNYNSIHYYYVVYNLLKLPKQYYT